MSYQTATPVTTPGHGSPQVVLDEESKTVFFSGAVADLDVYATLDGVDERDRPEFAVRAFKVGVLALKDARSVAKADYVEKEFQRMRSQFEQMLEQMIGGEGLMNRRLVEVFGEGGEMDAKLRAFLGDDGRFRLLMEEFLGEDGKLERAVEAAVGEDGSFRNASARTRLHGSVRTAAGSSPS